MTTRRTIPARGTGSGTSYGCRCGEHVGYADTMTEAIAAIRACLAPAGPPADDTTTPPPGGAPERTP